MARLAEVVVDALHPARLARFWAAVLDDFEVRAYDTAEIERLAAAGRTPDTDPSVALDGPAFTVFFQETAQSKRSRNRIHFDVVAQDVAAEVQRLVALGASIRDRRDGYTVLQDPEGNEFCVKAAKP